jgi:ATP adenylyltransferase
MWRTLFYRGGRASVQGVARALLNEDRRQLEYYSEITKNMVGRVLANRAMVKRKGAEYVLLGYDRLTADQVHQLRVACDEKLAEYVARRGDTIWEHRRRSVGHSAVPCAMKS